MKDKKRRVPKQGRKRIRNQLTWKTLVRKRKGTSTEPEMKCWGLSWEKTAQVLTWRKCDQSRCFLPSLVTFQTVLPTAEKHQNNTKTAVDDRDLNSCGEFITYTWPMWKVSWASITRMMQLTSKSSCTYGMKNKIIKPFWNTLVKCLLRTTVKPIFKEVSEILHLIYKTRWIYFLQRI